MDRIRHARAPRVIARCRVEFDRLDRRVVAESEDLSRRGAFVRTDELLPVGEITELDLTAPDGGAIFRIVARVAHLLSPSAARALGRHVGMGFEFLESEGDGALLASYLDDLIDDLTPPPYPVSEHQRLVLIEPNPPLRARLLGALEPAGFTVEAFADGAAAFAACADRPPDGVIAALHAPGLDGLTFLRSVAVHPRLSRVPVLLTADDVASDLTRLEAFRLGVRDYLSRPFLDEELVIRVRRATALAPRGTGEGAMLRGELSEISIATLLSLFEFERKSGILIVTDGARAARLFIAAGRIVKVDGGSGGDARDRLHEVLDWREGRFEYSGCEVVGADELGQPTTQLLLEHARLRDERQQAVSAG